jgi:hypothetical protein
MSDDALPELIDVTEESLEKKPQSKSSHLDTTTKKKEDEFKLVVSKRKRRELTNKMDDESNLADKSTMDDTMNEEYDTEDEELLITQSQNLQEDDQSQEMPIKKLKFPPINAEKLADGKFEMRKVHIPPNRYNPLKESWMKIYTPVVEYLKLQIRFNLKTRNVELRVSYKLILCKNFSY